MGDFCEINENERKRGKNDHSATCCAADVSRAGTGQRKMPHSRRGRGSCAICKVCRVRRPARESQIPLRRSCRRACCCATPLDFPMRQMPLNKPWRMCRAHHQTRARLDVYHCHRARGRQDTPCRHCFWKRSSAHSCRSSTSRSSSRRTSSAHGLSDR